MHKKKNFPASYSGFDRLLDMVLENPQLNENEKLRELVLKF